MLLLCVAVCILPVSVRGSTHWVMTEDGRIQSQSDSAFDMKRPYDLVSFMQQEERLASIQLIQSQLDSDQISAAAEEAEVPQHQEHVPGDDPADDGCSDIDERFSLYPSVFVDSFASVALKTLSLQQKSDAGTGITEPDCAAHMTLDFSMAAFEHLKSMKRRHLLSMSAEPALADMLFVDDVGVASEKVGVSELGRRAELVLRQRSRYWVGYHIASIYWRMRGDAPRAVECIRRSLHLVTRAARYVPLLDLGAVLHRAGETEAAAAVLHSALDHNSQCWHTHHVLGHVYSVLGEYGRALVCFNNTARLIGPPRSFTVSDEPLARALSCHLNSRSSVHTRSNLLQEGESCTADPQQQRKYLVELEEKLYREKAELSERTASMLAYSQWRALSGCAPQAHGVCIGQSFDDAGECDEWSDNDYFYTTDFNGTQRHLSDEKSDIGRTQQNVPVHGYFTSATFPARYVDNGTVSADDSDSGMSYSDCQREWAGQSQAEGAHFIYLPPQNKGFNVSWFLNEAIGLLPTLEHPLPWIPPVCPALPDHVTVLYDQLATVKSRARLLSRRLPEQLLAELPQLLAITGGGAASVAEIGQRITTAIKQEKVPRWVSYTLAALYWRLQGNLVNGIDCLRGALHHVPPELSDVPHLNMAAILLHLNDTEGAGVVARRAMAVNSVEPETNYLLGQVLFQLGNDSGAVWHYRRCLQHEPSHSAARRRLNEARCHVQYGRRDHQQQQRTAQQTSAHQGHVCEPGAHVTLDPGPLVDRELSEALGAGSLVCTSECVDEQGGCSETGVRGPGGTCRSQISCYNAVTEDGEQVLLVPAQHELVSADSCVTQQLIDEVGSLEQIEQMLLSENSLCKSSSRQTKQQSDRRQRAKRQHSKTEPDSGCTGSNPESEKLSPPVGSASRSMLADAILVHRRQSAGDGGGSSDPPDSVSAAAVESGDDVLPDVLRAMTGNRELPVAPSHAQCEQVQALSIDPFTSTWLAFASKNISAPVLSSLEVSTEPVCSESSAPPSLLSLDHLWGVRHRDRLVTTPETGLWEVLHSLVPETASSFLSTEQIGHAIASGLQKNATSWLLATSAALYWRVRGHPSRAVACLRVALQHAPPAHRDIPLISLANVLFRSSVFNGALIVCNQALEISPRFVVTHFTMANIYMAKGDNKSAMQWYMSTLDQQSSFEPARHRLIHLQCME